MCACIISWAVGMVCIVGVLGTCMGASVLVWGMDFCLDQLYEGKGCACTEWAW